MPSSIHAVPRRCRLTLQELITQNKVYLLLAINSKSHIFVTNFLLFLFVCSARARLQVSKNVLCMLCCGPAPQLVCISFHFPVFQGIFEITVGMRSSQVGTLRDLLLGKKFNCVVLMISRVIVSASSVYVHIVMVDLQ